MQLQHSIGGSGFPILCLHGHPGSGECMSVFADHLSRRFRTIAPDLRGYGKSRVSETFEMSDHLLDLESLLDRLGIDRTLVLGWSLGGILAMELALRSPRRVTGLILVATAARPRGNHPPISWQDNLFTGLAGIVNWVQPGCQWNIDTFGRRSLFRYLLGRQTPEAYRYIAREATPAYLRTAPTATKALRQALRAGYDRLGELETLTCPALVLAGERDRHITAASSRETADRLPNAEFYCYPDTAHLLPWEVRDRILADIDRWIEAHPEAARF